MRGRLQDPGTAGRRLARGKLGLLATDTVPGLHCRADAERTVARLRSLKSRPPDQPFLLLCADWETAAALLRDPSPRAVAYARRCWPGPFTLILPAGPATPAAALSPQGTVALRVPDRDWLRAVLRAAGGPLVSTSANRRDRAPVGDLESAAGLFGARVDFVAGPPAVAGASGIASGLLDLTVWPPRPLRPGPLPPPDPQVLPLTGAG